MERMKYIKPEVEILEFEFEGVIASSGESLENGMNSLPSDPRITPDPVDNIWDDKWL